MNKHLRELTGELTREGFPVLDIERRGNHPRLIFWKDGVWFKVIVAGTPSCWRHTKNTIRNVRRAYREALARRAA